MQKILLHSCCAPCSAAILEWMLENEYSPTIFFYNPNIYPHEEYLKRKEEIVRYASQIKVPFVDKDDEHIAWKEQVRGMEDEPERGARCLECFKIRLTESAKYASEHDFHIFTTSLVSSRWKDINQIFEAGRFATSKYPDKVVFWEKNWRKGGLYERRNILAKQFYNQQYCGCEYSINQQSYEKNSNASIGYGYVGRLQPK